MQMYIKCKSNQKQMYIKYKSNEIKNVCKI